MKLIAILCSTCLLAATSPAAELVRYQGRIHYVDVVNESLTGKGRKADGKDGHPLLLDENLQPKPAYLRQVEMLRGLASARSANPATPASEDGSGPLVRAPAGKGRRDVRLPHLPSRPATVRFELAAQWPETLGTEGSGDYVAVDHHRLGADKKWQPLPVGIRNNQV